MNEQRTLRGKTLFITGASRGIGKAIGLRAAQDGANIIIAAKTTMPHPKLEGTIHTAAAEITAAGGQAFAVEVDIRSEEQVQAAVDQGVRQFGGIDILVNNASALWLGGTMMTDMKRFDLLMAVNVRGTYLTSRICLPYLLKSQNPHILNLAPPLNLQPRWFGPHVAYSISKMGMSLCVLGMAEEFSNEAVAVNALWPRTAIATAAVRNLLGGEESIQRCRRPEIVADAAYEILTRPSRSCSGRFFLDEEVLREAGETDFQGYSVGLPESELLRDFFVG